MKCSALTVALASLLLSACDRGADESSLRQPGVDTLPGGAIRTVNNGPTEWADTAGWRLRLVQRIAPGDSGPGMLASPRHLVADRTGTIYVLDRRPAEIKVYAETGEFLRRIGREGAGPGEYGDYGEFELLGDTLIVNDRGNGRLVLFTTDGAHLRTITGVRGNLRGVTTDGRILMREYLAKIPATPLDQFAGEGIRAYRLDGTTVDSFFLPPQPKGKIWELVDATHDLGAYVPFGPGRVSTFDRTGNLLWGDQGAYRVVVARRGRDTLRVIEADAPMVAIADSLREAALQGTIKVASWVEGIAKLEDIPRTYPLWTDLRADAAGNIWVLRPDGVIDVFTAEGALRGSVPAPFETLDYSWWGGEKVYRIGSAGDGEAVIEVWQVVTTTH